MSDVTFHIPTPLRAYTGQAARVAVPGGPTVGDALASLLAAHPGLARHLRDDQGRLRSFVNVYLGDEDIRHLQGEATPLPAGAELMIVPSIAGGSADGPDGSPDTRPDARPDARLGGSTLRPAGAPRV